MTDDPLAPHDDEDGYDPFDFPDWLLPEDLDKDPPMSDYLALAEWYFVHMLDDEAREQARLIAAERRETLDRDHELDFDDPEAVRQFFYGWHHAQKTTMNFFPNDCTTIPMEHMLQHVVRNFQWNSILLLLTLEPTTPDPPEILL